MTEPLLHKAVALLTEGEGNKQTEIDNAIRTVRETAETAGLEPSAINSLMEFVVGRTDNGNVHNRCQLLHNLIPQSTVPIAAILTALGAMGSQPLSLKKLLFQWIILVYDLISDRGLTLHSLYDVILYYVQYDELRSVVCQLLCYLTRREDVKEYRVHRLTEIQGRVLVSKEVSESSLVALLSMYRRYCPHLVRLSFTSRRKEWFRPFEKKLAANILRMQGQRSLLVSESVSAVEPSTSSITSARLREQIQPPAKRKRLGVPTLSFYPLHTLTSGNTDRVPVGEMKSIADVCGNIHNLELPSQMAVVLESQLLCHVFCLASDSSAIIRFTYWLQHYLGYELDSYTPDAVETPNLLHMLDCLKEMTTFIMEPIPVVESFLSILLEVWNGTDYQTEVMALMEHLSLQPFSELEQDYLDPLNALFTKKDLSFRKLVLSTLTSLFTNLVTLEWPRHKRETESVGQESTQPVRLSLFHNSPSLWDDDDDKLNLDPKETLLSFVDYTEHMIEFALKEDGHHPLIQHAVSTFYETVTRLPEEYGISLLCVPHPLVVLDALVSPDVVMLDRMLTCFLSCGEAFSTLKRADRGVEKTAMFNSLVLDLCDALWRNSAFVNEKRRYPTLLFKIAREHLSSCGLSSTCDKFSIIHHPALLGMVSKFFRETQDPREHFQPSAIWNEKRFREAYLDYLIRNDLAGIANFIKRFIRSS